MIGHPSDPTNAALNVLVPGTLQQILEGAHPDPIWLQIQNIKPCETRDGVVSKYNLTMSDTRHTTSCVAAAPLLSAFEGGAIRIGDVLKVTMYRRYSLKGRVCLVLGNVALNESIRGAPVLGKPITLPEDNSSNNHHYLPHDPAQYFNQPMATSINVSGNSSYLGSSNSSHGAHPFQSNIGAMDANRPLATHAYAPQSGGNQNNNAASSSGKSAGFTEEPENIQSIANLSPYHNRWAIKARIINKSDIKKFANAKGEGKLFSCTCIDNSGEIRMTAFGDAVDKFFDLVHEGRVYFISNAQVKIAKRQFGVKNDYEIHLEPTSLITLARDGAASDVPNIRYNFVSISEIANMEKDSTCDIIGIVRDAGEVSNIVAKTTGKNLSKRDLTVVDTSNCSIRVTIWGAQAENYRETEMYPIIAIKNARVGDYNGRTLSTSSNTTITINPDISESHRLRGWFDMQGMHENSRSLTAAPGTPGGGALKDDRKTISQIKEEALGMGEKPDYFTLLATVFFIKEQNISYTACPTEGCSKKVHNENGMWHCEKCQRDFDRCDHRYVLQVQVNDHTGQQWLSIFNEVGEVLLGKNAEEMYYLKNSDETAFSEALKAPLHKEFMFRVKAKQENYQGETSVRCQVMSAQPVNAEEESKFLINKIEREQTGY